MYRGGKNCCVPHCDNNSCRDLGLSIHRITKDESLRKTWVKLLKAKGLCNPNLTHLVCSVHFPGGKKTYDNNPTVIGTNKTEERRVLVRHDLPQEKSTSPDLDPIEEEAPELDPIKEEVPEEVITNTTIELEEQLKDLKQKHEQLHTKYDSNMEVMRQCVFRLEQFIRSDIDFRFYTGFPDYATFKAFFNFLSPECHHLNYHGSTTVPILSDTQKKHGKPRAFPPEEELFMVLSRLHCGFLGQDLAHRYGMSPAHISQIWTTWITFLHQCLRSPAYLAK
jgi:hypothetical protein